MARIEKEAFFERDDITGMMPVIFLDDEDGGDSRDKPWDDGVCGHSDEGDCFVDIVGLATRCVASVTWFVTSTHFACTLVCRLTNRRHLR